MDWGEGGITSRRRMYYCQIVHKFHSKLAIMFLIVLVVVIYVFVRVGTCKIMDDIHKVKVRRKVILAYNIYNIDR